MTMTMHPIIKWMRQAIQINQRVFNEWKEKQKEKNLISYADTLSKDEITNFIEAVAFISEIMDHKSDIL